MNNYSNPFDKSQNKDTKRLTQEQTIFQYLLEFNSTASMVADATGVPQKNICRYKRDLEKIGRVWELEKKYCKKTGFLAWYLTTNPEKAIKQNVSQLNLF